MQKWKHDKYKTLNLCKITNLHWKVTPQDLEGLFTFDGELKWAKIVYDPSGRSTGEAELLFKSSKGVDMAIENYNNVELDGMKMNIEQSDSSRFIKKSQKKIQDRLGKRIQDRLGKRIEDRLGTNIESRLGKKVKKQKKDINAMALDDKLVEPSTGRSVVSFPEVAMNDGSLL